MPYSAKGFFEINEDMVQILLMLEVLFTQDSKVEDLFCGASSGSEPSLYDRMARAESVLLRLGSIGDLCQIISLFISFLFSLSD